MKGNGAVKAGWALRAVGRALCYQGHEQGMLPAPFPRVTRAAAGCSDGSFHQLHLRQLSPPAVFVFSDFSLPNEISWRWTWAALVSKERSQPRSRGTGHCSVSNATSLGLQRLNSPGFNLCLGQQQETAHRCFRNAFQICWLMEEQ